MAEGDDNQRIVTLGRITGVYGVRGWLRAYSDTAPRENIVSYSPWYLHRDGQWEAWSVEKGKRHGTGMVVKLAGCDDRDVAATLVNVEIGVKRSQLANNLAPDEYYWTDLEGLQVVTKEGVELGRVDHLIETGANDVLVVKGERERLIPYLPEQVVLAVELTVGKLKVDWDPDF